MKTVKNKKILLVVAMMLVLSLTVGLTLAYFSDYTAAQGKAKLALGGQTEIKEDVTDTQKTVRVNNVGETNVVVRVKIIMPKVLADQKDSITLGDGWEKHGDYYYYDQILKPGESTSTIVAKTEVKGDVELGDSFDVVVALESAQPTYDDNDYVEIPDGWDWIPEIKAQ